MICEDFVCYTKNDKVLSVGMNLNNIIAKHYYSENAAKKGCFRKNLTIPLPLMLLNHENSFLKDTFLNTNKENKGNKGNKGNKKNKKGKKNKKNSCEVIDDSFFDKLINLNTNKKFKQTRKKKRKKSKKKSRKLFIF
jgi:hypothetical protein